MRLNLHTLIMGAAKKFKVSIIEGKNIYFASDRGQCLNLVGWRKEDFKIIKQMCAENK